MTGLLLRGNPDIGPVEFLTLLWGDTPPGVIQTWDLARRRSSYSLSPHGAAGATGQADQYTCVALAPKRLGPKNRARADQAIAIAGLWLDIDVAGGPEDRDTKTYVPDLDAAHGVATLYAQPTVLVHSGYGLQAWWLLPEPWRFKDRGEQHAAATMAAQWHALHRAAIPYALDSTHDLARLMRLPGTVNAKGGQRRPVIVAGNPGPRPTLDTLRALCATAGPVEVGGPVADPGISGALPDITLGARALEDGKLGALLVNSEEFADTWHHRLGLRTKDWSLSEYDLALCSHAARAGLTDQELAGLIAAHRLHHDQADTKHRRGDYLRRTIARAREGAERQTAADRLAALAYGAAA